MTTKAIKTQELILETALKHFLKEGYAGASLRKIVKDAGLTTAHFISIILQKRCYLMH